MHDNNSNVITVCNDSVLHAPKEHDVDAIYRQVKDLQMKKKIEKKYAMFIPQRLIRLVRACVRSNCQSI